jgi:hypothetical protein
MWVWPNDPMADSLNTMPELTAYDPAKGTEEAGELWVLHKGARRLRCVLSTHPLGWEIRAVTGAELNRSQVCKVQPEVFTVAGQWKAEAAAKGWRE